MMVATIKKQKYKTWVDSLRTYFLKCLLTSLHVRMKHIFTFTSDPFYKLLIKSKLLATCITVKTLLAQKEQSIFLMHERYHGIYETLTTDQHQVWPSLSSCGIYCIFGEIVVINSYKSHDLSFPRLRSGEYIDSLIRWSWTPPPPPPFLYFLATPTR